MSSVLQRVESRDPFKPRTQDVMWSLSIRYIFMRLEFGTMERLGHRKKKKRKVLGVVGCHNSTLIPQAAST